MADWGIRNIADYVGPAKTNNGQSNSPEVWETHLPNMFKLNFNGATKGNPGLAGVGGVFQNAAGDIVGIYWGYIGENMNNMAELKALLAGINMVVTNGWFSFIIEGDSQIIIQMAMNLLHGKSVNKVRDNW